MGSKLSEMTELRILKFILCRLCSFYYPYARSAPWPVLFGRVWSGSNSNTLCHGRASYQRASFKDPR